MKWSPTSTFDRRAYSPENLGSVRQKDFCNTIPRGTDIVRSARLIRLVPHPDSCSAAVAVGTRVSLRAPRTEEPARDRCERTNCEIARSADRQHQMLVLRARPHHIGPRGVGLRVAWITIQHLGARADDHYVCAGFNPIVAGLFFCCIGAEGGRLH
jgi:hypothetical protein